MANSYFQFKEFLINQDQCGMKVTTDACLFGAFVASHIKGSQGKILDIGTGTGLLSLMIAQETDATIEAMEIDESAYKQAIDNFNNSPWSNQLSVTHQSYQDFQLQAQSKQYDHIICNPPFFSQHLRGSDQFKNKALHDETKLLVALYESVGSLLSPTGQFHLLLPGYEMKQFIEQVKVYSLYPFQELTVYQKADKPVFRRVVSFKKDKMKKSTLLTLVVHGKSSQYSEAFIRLLRPYYLHL